MFYKFENGEWLRGYTVCPPSNIVYDESNKNDVPDGWVWYDEEPAEYTEWVELINTNRNNSLPA
jgi:hypothetical protein